MQGERLKVLRTLLRDEIPLYIKVKAKRGGYRSTSNNKGDAESIERYVKHQNSGEHLHSKVVYYTELLWTPYRPFPDK